jgi:coronin-7
VFTGTDNTLHVLSLPDGVEVFMGKEANASSRGYKALFAGEEIISVGFARGLVRQIYLYNPEAGEEPVQKVMLDTSPSPLIPHYDEDTRILFLWARGSRQIHPYQLTNELTALPTFDSSDLQTAVAFLPKKVVDVRAVEVLQGVRMTGGKIERFGMRIPRSRMEFFQDDVFIPTVDTESSVMTAVEFLDGRELELPLLDLKPEDMIPRKPRLSPRS